MNCDVTIGGPPDTADPHLREIASNILRMRRHRDKLLGRELFAEPVWDMLLELYVGDARGRPLSTGDLIIAGAVPATTARRCMKQLKNLGIFNHLKDPLDRRRSLCILNPAIRQAIEDTLTRFRDHVKTTL